MSISRALLSQAFPDNPRLRAELEAAFDLVDSLRDQATSLEAQLNIVAGQIGQDIFQPQSELLTALSGLSGHLGAVEITSDNQASIRPIDASDPASLMSRGAAYSVLVGIGGIGPSTSRPTPPTNAVAVYFDTTLAAAGKPIFWKGTGWVDATGTAV